MMSISRCNRERETESYITPTCLNPWPWVLFIEDLGVVEIDAILVDVIIVKVETKATRDTFGSSDLVIRVDIVNV